VGSVDVKVGDAVSVGELLLTIELEDEVWMDKFSIMAIPPGLRRSLGQVIKDRLCAWACHPSNLAISQG